MNNCEKHNWLYYEFDEPCPLCEAATEEQNRIITLLETELIEYKHIPTDVHGNYRLTLHALINLIKGQN